MKGYVEITISNHKYLKLLDVYNKCTDFIDSFDQDKYKKVKTKKYFFGLFEETVEYIDYREINNIDLPYGCQLLDLGFLEPHYAVELNVAGEAIREIIRLYKVNPTMLIDNKLVRWYNAALEFDK